MRFIAGLRSRIRGPLGAAVLLVAATLLTSPSPSAGDTYAKFQAGASDTRWGTVDLSNGVANAPRKADTAYGRMLRQNPTGGRIAFGVKTFAANTANFVEASTPTSATGRGYIAGFKFGVKYHLWPAAFVNDRLEGSYSLDANATFTEDYLSPDTPLSDANVLAAAEYDPGKDVLYTKALPILGSVKTWADVRKVGLKFSWIGQPGPTVAGDYDATNLYIDHLSLYVLQKMTVKGDTITPTTITPQGLTNVPLLRLNARVFSNNAFTVTRIKFNLTGSCTVADIAKISLYRDSTATTPSIKNNGVIDVGYDTLFGSTAVTSLTDQTLNLSLPNTNWADKRYWLLVVDLADDAVAGHTIGMEMVEGSITPTKAPVDQVAVNADRITAGSAGDPDPLWPIATTRSILISRKASLTVAFDAGLTASVIAGDDFPVRIRVTNAAGANTAENVLPPTPTVAGTGGAGSSTPQTAVTLVGGQWADFTWTFTAAADGVISLTGSATGRDETTKKTVSSPAVTSPDITITPSPVPILSCVGFSAHPDTVSADGQTFKVQVAYKNVGTMTADQVQLYQFTTDENWKLERDPASTGTATDDTVGLAAQSIAPGAVATWNYTFTPTGAGTFSLRGYAKGTNCNRNDGASNVITICPRASLANVAINTSPATFISSDSSFTLTATVRNDGGTTAVNVIPATPTLTEQTAGDPDPVILSGPTPASASIAPGASTSFQWTYDSKGASVQGKYKLGVKTNYNDGGSNKAYLTAVQTSAAFTITNTVSPAKTKVVGGAIRKSITYGDDSSYYVVDEASVLTAYASGSAIPTPYASKWSYNFAANAITIVGASICVTAEPEGPVVWVSSDDGRIYAVLDEGGSCSGYIDTDIIDSFILLNDGVPIPLGPIVWGDHAYCSIGAVLYKRDKTDGAVPAGWLDYTAPATITTAPAVDNNYIYFGCQNGKMYCINIATGAPVTSSVSFGARITSSPFAFDDRIYTGNADGILIRINSPTNFGDVTTVDLNGTGTAGALSDLWVGLANDFIWVTDTTNCTLYKRNLADLSAVAAYPFAGENLTAPIEWNGVVYFTATTATATGKFYAIKKSDGTSLAKWPYISLTQPCYCPITLDVGNTIFVSGSDDKTVYFFGMPVP